MSTPANMNDLELFLLSAPLVFFLVIAYFRLDTILTPSKARTSRTIFEPASKQEKSAMYSDPDGRPWDQP